MWAAHERYRRTAIDGVVDRSAHVHVVERRNACIEKEVAGRELRVRVDLAAITREERVEQPRRLVLDLAEDVVRVSALDRADCRCLVGAEPHSDLVRETVRLGRGGPRAKARVADQPNEPRGLEARDEVGAGRWEGPS